MGQRGLKNRKSSIFLNCCVARFQNQGKHIPARRHIFKNTEQKPWWKRWCFGHSFYVCCHGCIWQPRQANPHTFGHSGLKNGKSSNFKNVTSQGTVREIRYQWFKYSWYLWQKRLTKTLIKNDNVNEPLGIALLFRLVYIGVFA